MIETKDVERMIKLLDQVEPDILAVAETINQCDNETQDILHELEIVPHTHNERGHISKRLVEVRKARRVAKDAYELLLPLMEWINQNQTAINRLKATLGDMRKQDKRHTNRVYIKKAGAEKGTMIGGEVNAK